MPRTFPRRPRRAALTPCNTCSTKRSRRRATSTSSGQPDDLNNPNPTTFDCSSLTEWAAHQAGVDIPRTSYEQYLFLKDKGLVIPVEQAKNIPGALIFHFSSNLSPAAAGRPRPTLRWSRVTERTSRLTTRTTV